MNEAVSRQPYSVLFLCTGNSARSIMAECILNRLGEGRFKAYSAGSMPQDKVNPNTIKLLQQLGYDDTAKLRSKSWDEFIEPNAPKIDFVITVCSNAAGETCPIWQGHPLRAHWDIPDPAAVRGSEDQIMQAFTAAYHQLCSRIALFVEIPFADLDAPTLRRRVNEIGNLNDTPAPA